MIKIKKNIFKIWKSLKHCQAKLDRARPNLKTCINILKKQLHF